MRASSERPVPQREPGARPEPKPRVCICRTTRLDASLTLGRLDVDLVPLRRALIDLGSLARLVVRPLPGRGEARCIRLQSGTGAAQRTRLLAGRARTHFPSSNAALRRRAAALALTAACSHLPSGSFVGFSAAAPNFSSLSSEEPCRGIFARVHAATRGGQPAANKDKSRVRARAACAARAPTHAPKRRSSGHTASQDKSAQTDAGSTA